MLTLAKLREQQRAAGLTAPPDNDESARVPTLVDGLPVNKDGHLVNSEGEPYVLPVVYAKPKSQEKNDSPNDGSGGRFDEQRTGFTRIFPATFAHLGAIPGDWKAANWSGPSPWCKVEGLPEHPEFEKNLAAFESAL